MANLSSAMAVCAAFCAPAAALADTFDFETGLSFMRLEQTTVNRSFVLPTPPGLTPVLPPIFVVPTVTTDIDNDRTSFSGTWFVSGVNINEGPRTRAAFLSRASSVSLGYSDIRTSVRNRFTFDDPNTPNQVQRDSFDARNFSIGGRYVWQGSGWFGLGNIETLSGDLGADAESYRLGVGKYIGERTSVDLSVRYDDFSLGTSTTYAVGLSHVGDLFGGWQYGADVTLSRADFSAANELMDAAFSLYPSRSVAFGLRYSGLLENLDDFSDYDAFASWFINESVEVSARFGTIDRDNNQFFRIDEDRWGLGVRVRF